MLVRENSGTELLQHLGEPLAAVDVGEQSEVVAWMKAGERRPQPALEGVADPPFLACPNVGFIGEQRDPVVRKILASAGKAPVLSLCSVNSRLARLLASTSG